MEFFKAERLSNRVTLIVDLTQVYMYLVCGSERALLIDTGSGIGDLRAFVQGLTSLPLTVLCTHGHVDHAGGAAQFDQVYLHPADWDLATNHASRDMKRGYLEHTAPEASANIADADILPARGAPWQPLTDGQTFILGGVTVRIRALPGHTQGMCCTLIEEERALILGDACNPCTFLFSPEASTVRDYGQALRRFKVATDSTYDTAYLSHGSPTIPKSILDGNITVCDDILSGHADDVPFPFMGETHLLAKAVGSQMQRLDGGLGNIVYNQNKL